MRLAPLASIKVEVIMMVGEDSVISCKMSSLSEWGKGVIPSPFIYCFFIAVLITLKLLPRHWAQDPTQFPWKIFLQG